MIILLLLINISLAIQIYPCHLVIKSIPFLSLMTVHLAKRVQSPSTLACRSQEGNKTKGWCGWVSSGPPQCRCPRGRHSAAVPTGTADPQKVHCSVHDTRYSSCQLPTVWPRGDPLLGSELWVTCLVLTVSVPGLHPLQIAVCTLTIQISDDYDDRRSRNSKQHVQAILLGN